MLFFIKSIKDWSTLGTARVISYDLPLSSDDGQTGTLVVADGVTPAHVGQAITDEAGFNLWIIKAVKPAETEITVTLGEFIEVFDRNIIYDESLSQLTTTAFIRQVLINNFKLISDPEYVVQVTPVDGGSTGRVIADLTSDNLFNPTAYIRKARQYGIAVQITSTVAGAVMVFREENYAHNLPFDDGHSQLVVFEQDKNVVAKVTAVKKAGTTNYYIQPDGSISTTPPSPRIQGTWNTIVIAEGEESSTTEKVKEEFAKTNDSKKLEFYSDREFEHGSRVSFFVRGELFTAQISGVSISSTDDRYHYTAGNLPRTLTDKMRKISNQHPNAVISSSGGGDADRVPMTYAVNSSRLTDFEYTAYAYPELGLCFVQGSATLNVSHAAGTTSYTIATLDDGFSQYIPGTYVPGSLRSAKNFDFAVTTNGHLAIWFNEAGAVGDTLRFAGWWIIGGDTT